VWAPAPGHIKLITVVEADKASNQVLGRKLTIAYGPDADEYESLDEVRVQKKRRESWARDWFYVGTAGAGRGSEVPWMR
jgi:hypothetical protein